MNDRLARLSRPAGTRIANPAIRGGSSVGRASPLIRAVSQVRVLPAAFTPNAHRAGSSMMDIDTSKITRGEATVGSCCTVEVGGNRVASCAGLASTLGPEQNYWHAALIADAFNTFAKTGLTPSELAEQRGELLAAVQAMVEWDNAEKRLPPYDSDGGASFSQACALCVDAFDKARAALTKATNHGDPA